MCDEHRRQNLAHRRLPHYGRSSGTRRVWLFPYCLGLRWAWVRIRQAVDRARGRGRSSVLGLGVGPACSRNWRPDAPAADAPLKEPCVSLMVPRGWCVCRVRVWVETRGYRPRARTANRMCVTVLISGPFPYPESRSSQIRRAHTLARSGLSACFVSHSNGSGSGPASDAARSATAHSMEQT